MKTTGIAELKAKLSEFLTSVKAGEEIVVTDRGKPFARIAPLKSALKGEKGLEDLERAGLIRRPTRPLDASFFELPRGEDPEGAVLESLLAEREEGW